MTSLKIILALLFAVSLSGCFETARIMSADPSFRLPPRVDIIPDKEPFPDIKPTDSESIALLKVGAAFGRANERLGLGATNYNTLAAALSAK